MSEHEYKTIPGLQPLLSRQPAESPEDKEAPVAASIQRNPLDQITCRAGDTSCARAHASALNRSSAAEPTRTATALLRLQRQYGNRYVQRVLGLSRKAEGEAAVVPPEVQQAIERTRGGGQALDSTVQAQMGQAFNADFSGVRVHTNAEADALNRTLNARAFTTGHDIFFRQGEYRPGSASGRQLLAHELTHVVQQTGDRLGGAIQGKLMIGQPGDIYEQEADRMAQAYTHWEQGSGRTQGAEASVRRQMPEEEKKKEEVKMQRKLQDGMLQRQPEEEKEEEGMLAKFQGDTLQRQGEGEEEEE